MKLFPMTVQVMSILSNVNALAYAPHPNCEHTAVVLVDLGKEYVTWELDLNTSAKFLGHYYRYDDNGGQDGARRVAMDDFIKRAGLPLIN